MGKPVLFDVFASRCRYLNYWAEMRSGPGCNHPQQEEVERFGPNDAGIVVVESYCYSFSCPLGYELNPDEPEDLAELEQAGIVNPADYYLVPHQES